MKNMSSQKSSLILLIVLIATLLFAIYYYMILPKKDEVQSLERSIHSIQGEIDSLQEQNTLVTSVQTSTSNLYEIRQKLPQNRNIDQLLLNLEEIEYMTETRITAINFNSYDQLVSESGIQNGEDEQSEEPESDIEAVTAEKDEKAEENKEPNEEEQLQTPISSISSEFLPSELKLITFSLQVEGAKDEQLKAFIEEVEQLQRIMHIDTINYSLPGEEDEFNEESSDVVNMSIQATTFYYEGES